MKLNTWLKGTRGRAKALAAHLPVSCATVSEWAKEVKPVPVDRCMPIEAFTAGEVSRRDLRSDWETHWPELRQAGEQAERRDPTRINPFPDLERRALPAVAGDN